MKKLFMLTIAAAFASVAMAQEQKKAENPAKDHPAGHECYMMKDNAMHHCMGTRAEAQAADVKLENGAVITKTGKVVTAEGESVDLKNGQCVDLEGMIGDCGEMHKAMRQDKSKEGDSDKM